MRDTQLPLVIHYFKTIEKENIMTELKIAQVFEVDGHIFHSKAEAQNFIRRPKIKAALEAFTKAVSPDLADFIIENQEAIEDAFEVGTVRRLTKSDISKLEKAIKVLGEAQVKGTEFLVSMWPELEYKYRSVKCMTDEEKAAAIRNSLLAISDNDLDLADWIMTHKDAILEAFEAGVEKRQINPAAKNALAAYQAKKAAEKAAKEAGKVPEDEDGTEVEFDEDEDLE